MSKKKKLLSSQGQNSKPLPSKKATESQIDPKVRAVFEKAIKRAKELHPTVEFVSFDDKEIKEET
jgi:hypothetical protein